MRLIRFKQKQECLCSNFVPSSIKNAISIARGRTAVCSNGAIVVRQNRTSTRLDRARPEVTLRIRNSHINRWPAG